MDDSRIQVQNMVDLIISNFFPKMEINCYATIVKKRDYLGIRSDRVVKSNGMLKNEIVISEKDYFNNDPKLLVDIVSQIIQIIAARDNVLASNRGRYFNKWLNCYFEKYGVITTKGKYGYQPVECDQKYYDCFPKFKTKKATLYLPYIEGHKSSTRKLICPACGLTVRATSNVSLICGRCYKKNNINYLIVEKKMEEDK